ncbi:DNA-binding protein [Homoserinimonas sp. A520]
MFVISADQKSSRTTKDLVGHWREVLNDDYSETLTLPADRNAGDEIQVLTDDAATVLQIALRLARSGNWSVGIGVGAVRRPLPAETREASGPAFNAARDAVSEAKKRPTRFAVRADAAGETADAWPNSRDVQSVIDLLLEVRKKRSQQGWELHDTLETTSTQAEAARVLGITPAAASARASAAALKIERQALPTIVRLLHNLDRVTGPTETKEHP